MYQIPENMNDSDIRDIPDIHAKLEARSNEIGFIMPSDLNIGKLLKTLITSKPKSNILELGTGAGLSLSWMIDGMDFESTLTTIDNDPILIEIANNFFGQDKRVKIICADAAEWIKNYKGLNFDLIFADSWPGKYSDVTDTLNLLKVRGFYVIVDMSAQTNWSDGHQEKVNRLVDDLEKRDDLNLTKMNWSTGVIICTKKE